LRGNTIVGRPTSAPTSGGANLIDGTALAKLIREEVAAEAAALRELGVIPGLTVVLVGDDPGERRLRRLRRRRRRAKQAWPARRFACRPTRRSATAGVGGAAQRGRSVHGILVQMPLPKQIDPDTVILHIDPKKDVDGFHPVNVGKLLSATETALRRARRLECSACSCTTVSRRRARRLCGSSPQYDRRKADGALMVQEWCWCRCDRTVCHSRTARSRRHTRRADILIVAAGRPRMITGDMVKPARS
jgi:methylenetetrahydrofolate dehydrogenase (NADP+)/methenyltetrahydrofolate cyclohydrolase